MYDVDAIFAFVEYITMWLHAVLSVDFEKR
ncbi:hypothetical protein BAAM0483_01950 [Bifidobacterium animalis subsp. animalis MCC 0483]|uniref:Uncharacterized protein n=1 Tax=Bifidobacterium animalis subsp. animalis MCC 0483 TaxID=1365955 RepID=A0AB34TB23_9BIFI|nr:hypothetical protein BAAM0483_01950 [Bifidobacterium animalis subsp. animalis MCC 0483]